MLITLLLCAFAHLSFGDHFCGYDRFRNEHPPLQFPSKVSPSLLSRNEWKPMRVFFDMNSAERTYKNHPSLINDTQIIALHKTLDNIAVFLGNLLRVSPETEPINGHDADLVIEVSLSKSLVDDKVLGTAWRLGTSQQLGRPNRGGMMLYPLYIPEVAQDVDSIDRLFFTVIFHELMHVLGMSKGDWRAWVDKDGKRYENPTYKHTDTRYGKTFTILKTPAVHRWATDRFGLEEFWANCPSGVEIEDGGGSGTAGSHPESRIYMSEVMCGIFVGYVSISNLSLSILEDTGWYQVNYSMAEPYAFGDGRSLMQGPLTGFPHKPPQLSFPSHYLCWNKETMPVCHHDFRSKGYCSPVEDWNCPGSTSDDRKACKMKTFVNPMNIEVRGAREEFDYLYFKVGNTSQRCDDVTSNSLLENKDTGELYGTDSMCFMSSLSKNGNNIDIEMPRCHRVICEQFDRMRIEIEGEVQYCTNEDQILEFEGFQGYFRCPDPHLLCGMKLYLKCPPMYGSNSLQFSAIGEYSPTQSEASNNVFISSDGEMNFSYTESCIYPTEYIGITPTQTKLQKCFPGLLFVSVLLGYCSLIFVGFCCAARSFRSDSEDALEKIQTNANIDILVVEDNMERKEEI